MSEKYLYEPFITFWMKKYEACKQKYDDLKKDQCCVFCGSEAIDELLDKPICRNCDDSCKEIYTEDYEPEPPPRWGD